MSVALRNTERAKFTYLLQLAQQQIKALETDDMHAFDRILASKGVLIESLTDAQSMMAADPTLASVIEKIKDCDKSAQRLLYRKVGRIMREMAELQQFKKARRAYRKLDSPARRAPDTALFVDQKS